MHRFASQLRRMIRQSVSGLAKRSCAHLIMGARSDAKPDPTFADRAHIGLAAQSARRQPKNKCGLTKRPLQGSTTGEGGAIHALRAQGCRLRRMAKAQAARMLERKASISERRTSASRRSAPDAFSTSLAADPASAEAVLTPTMLLETSEVPPAAC